MRSWTYSRYSPIELQVMRIDHINTTEVNINVLLTQAHKSLTTLVLVTFSTYRQPIEVQNRKAPTMRGVFTEYPARLTLAFTAPQNQREN